MDLFVVLALIQAMILISLASRLWSHQLNPTTLSPLPAEAGRRFEAAQTAGEGAHAHTFLHAFLEETAGRSIAVYRCTCGATERRELPAFSHQLAFQLSPVAETA